GLRCAGLVQIAFWSRRILFGVPAKVIVSDFSGCSCGGGWLGRFWGSGASGSEVEAAVATAAVGGSGAAGWRAGLWADENLAVASKREAVRPREALNLGYVTGIGKFGRQHAAPLAGGYHRRTVRGAQGTLVRNVMCPVARAVFPRGDPSPPPL